MTVAQALAAAGVMGLARLDAQLLLLQTLGRTAAERAWLLAHDADQVDAAHQRRFMTLCGRRAAGEPLAYIIGRREFFGLELLVDSRVLDPRPDTETLVEWALELVPPGAAARVADLGTGSGAIALAIKANRPLASVTAIDNSAAALEVAAANARALGLELELRQANWLEDTQVRFDLIVSNPPYIAAGDAHLAALAHEPTSALIAGTDGMQDLRTITRQAPARLADGGWLVMEHGYNQADAVRRLLSQAGFRQVQTRRDLGAIERCSGGRWLELG